MQLESPHPIVSTTRIFQHGEHYGNGLCNFKEQIMLVERHEGSFVDDKSNIILVLWKLYWL